MICSRHWIIWSPWAVTISFFVFFCFEFFFFKLLYSLCYKLYIQQRKTFSLVSASYFFFSRTRTYFSFVFLLFDCDQAVLYLNLLNITIWLNGLFLNKWKVDRISERWRHSVDSHLARSTSGCVFNMLLSDWRPELLHRQLPLWRQPRLGGQLMLWMNVLIKCLLLRAIGR